MNGFNIFRNNPVIARYGSIAIAIILIVSVSIGISNSHFKSITPTELAASYVSTNIESADIKALAADVTSVIAEKNQLADVVIDEKAVEKQLIELLAEKAGDPKAVKNLAEKLASGDAEADVLLESIASKLIEKEAVDVNAFAVTADGKNLVTLASETDAQSILAALQSKFAGKDETWSGQFVENITVDPVVVGLNDFTTSDAAIDYLLTGGVDDELYEVQTGDTVWDICQDLGLTEEQIEQSNPGYNLDLIHVGDKLKTNRVTPLVHYSTTGTVKKTEAIEFKVKEEQTDTLFVGETKVAQEGVDGAREVTLQETRVNGNRTESKELSSVTISEPKDKIIQVGTKEKPVVVAPAPRVYTYSNSSSSSSSSSSSKSTASTYTPPKSFKGGDGVVADAYQLLGIPYVWGGSSLRGFDCSGLTQYVMAKNGVNIPRTASAQSRAGKYVKLSDAQPGDLVCWDSPGTSHHIGIYIGGGKYIHAPRPGQRVSVWTFSYYKPKFAVRF
jgi:cell wall-associated NlpC family hydrolase